ncbi:hypothetical protein TRFO_37894 [Tritrichomonas foetus]|uniref:TPR Domain containing protein n=1 Tax=Tritrichomonas foetus TaxID=1144522 RepID=A0A1J4JFF3_9EUKA|nr:hypothetical protein TRFO_37894 [Tritrichomonas foetus]|eukprot:OHS95956.1 hypothetical protein TRFO_37894 [Tritrichomonas foetus]
MIQGQKTYRCKAFKISHFLYSEKKMESFVTLKNSGIQRMNSKKYNDAIRDFTTVIDKLNPTTNEEAVLKGVCLLNRSSCNLLKDDFDSAIADANAVIEMYQNLRTDEQQKSMTPEQMRADPLTGVLSLAYIRRGEAFEARLEFLNAFHEYAASNTLQPDGESQRAMRSLLLKLNVPEINQKDKDLSHFAVLLLQFVNEPSLIVSLTNLTEYLSSAEIKPDILAKYDQNKCPNILYAISQLYIENEFIVIGCITSLRFLAERRLVSVWNGFLVVREIMSQWNRSENICGECLKLLQFAPTELYKFFVKDDFLTPISNSLRLKLTPQEVEIAFMLLYNIASSPSQIQFVVESGAVDHILAHKSLGSLMLLSKIAMVEDVLIQTHSSGGFDWIIEKVKENSERLDLVVAAAMIISRYLLHLEEESRPTKSEVGLMFDTFVPLVIKNSKDSEVVSSCFAAFALGAEFNAEKITELKLIRAASAILAIHIKRTTVAQNIVTFIYECAKNGLLNEIKETKPVLPTVMNALQENPTFQTIVERAVVLAAMCDHPNKETLMAAAMEKFPNSTFLLRFSVQNQKQ